MVKNNTLTYRVQQLEKNYDKLDGKIDILLTNDVPHLRQDMAKLGTRMNVLTTVNIVALAITLIIAKLL